MSKISDAYTKCQPIRDALANNGRCIEVTEDKAGILWERWILHNGTSVVLFATPHWYDVFSPITTSSRISDTVEAIERAAQAERNLEALS